MKAPDRISPARRIACSIVHGSRRVRSRPLSESDLKGRALIFAPHQDDETLGCGGTIVKKLAAGAEISSVFLTDGSGSHSERISHLELAEIRRSEAIAALAMLGVNRSDVHFLDAPDGRLVEHAKLILPQLESLVADYRPQQIYVPCARDRLSDHVATYSLVRSALLAVGLETVLFEYPIWFWNFWPFMRRSPNERISPLKQGMQTLRESIALVRDFNSHVDISDELELKSRALMCHQTQMTRFDGSPSWPTLQDVAGGDFLANLLTTNEIFIRSSVSKGAIF